MGGEAMTRGRKARPARPAHDERDPVAGIGPRIRAYRLERGMTLKQLGAATGLSHPFLSQVERGLARPSVRSIAGIARALRSRPRRSGPTWTRPVPGTWMSSAARGPRTRPDRACRRGSARVLSDENQPFFVLELSGGSKEFADPPRPRYSGDCMLYVVRGAVEAASTARRTTSPKATRSCSPGSSRVPSAPAGMPPARSSWPRGACVDD